MKIDGPLAGKIGWAVKPLYAACGALRLALKLPQLPRSAMSTSAGSSA